MNGTGIDSDITTLEISDSLTVDSDGRVESRDRESTTNGGEDGTGADGDILTGVEPDIAALSEELIGSANGDAVSGPSLSTDTTAEREPIIVITDGDSAIGGGERDGARTGEGSHVVGVVVSVRGRVEGGINDAGVNGDEVIDSDTASALERDIFSSGEGVGSRDSQRSAERGSEGERAVGGGEGAGGGDVTGTKETEISTGGGVEGKSAGILEVGVAECIGREGGSLSLKRS